MLKRETIGLSHFVFHLQNTELNKRLSKRKAEYRCCPCWEIDTSLFGRGTVHKRPVLTSTLRMITYNWPGKIGMCYSAETDQQETLYHRDDAILYIAYVMLIQAAPIPADRWHCSLWP